MVSFYMKVICDTLKIYIVNLRIIVNNLSRSIPIRKRIIKIQIIQSRKKIVPQKMRQIAKY